MVEIPKFGDFLFTRNTMTINILTLFPEMFESITNQSIIKRAQEKNIVKIKTYDLRDWAEDKHKTTDDTAYGGGAGMIMKPDVIDRAIHDIKCQINDKIKISNYKNNFNKRSDSTASTIKTILLTPKGKRFNQKIAQSLSSYSNLLLICGHYGGFDERIRKLVDMEISLGDFVLTGGEIPALAIIDAIARLVPGVINPESLAEETHSKPGKIQYPQYTRPASFKPISKDIKTLNVPKVLLSGDHKKISVWKEKYYNSK